jgi:hypothetical protein
MELKIKVLALAAITVIGLAIPLSAQTSNQNQATVGVFGTDVDSFMDVNYYGDVNFGKWFGYLGGETSGIFNLGYATKLGGIYLGTYYSGNIFKIGTSETTTLTTTWDTSLHQLVSRSDTKIYDRTTTTTNTNNNIAALIGVAGMGIKAGFYEDITTYNTPYNADRDSSSTVTHNADGSITYSENDSLSYEESDGDLIPYLEWGMQLKAGSITLAPRVGVAVNFYQDKFIDKYYGTARTEYNGVITGQERIESRGHNNGYTALGIGVGADFYLNDSMYVGLDYDLVVNIYNQSFGDAGRSGSVKGVIDWTSSNNYSITEKFIDRTEKDNSIEIYVNEISYMSHSITPAFWKENALGENLKLGVLVKLPITITNQSVSSYTDRWETTETAYYDDINKQYNTTTITNTHTAGSLLETSSFSISPTVGIGVSYDLIPNKFTVNAGINIKVPSFSSASIVTSQNGVDSTYTKTENGYGNNKYTASETLTVDDPTMITDSVTTVTDWSELKGSIVGGFVFNFNDNFALDLLASTDPYSTDAFSISLTNLRVLFSIKF